VLGARVAYDEISYWFWLRTYDHRSYYICDIDKVDEAGIAPFMRPVFLRCASGVEFLWVSHPEEGPMSFTDGEYEVEAIFSHGLPVEQTYRLDGRVVLSMAFKEYQSSRGMSLPKRLSIKIDGLEELEVDMGDPVLNPKDPPYTSPPKYLEGIGIQP
jgi:hypothetical protein